MIIHFKLFCRRANGCENCIEKQGINRKEKFDIPICIECVFFTGEDETTQ